MNKTGMYGALFFVCMMLCHILGWEFAFEYLYLAEIGLAAVSGIMLYMAVYEFYRDMRSYRQSQQEYVEGLKNAVTESQANLEAAIREQQTENQTALEGFRTESRNAIGMLKDVCQNAAEGFRKENRNMTDRLIEEWKKAAESFDAENRNAIAGFGVENGKLVEKIRTENKNLIEGFCAESRNMIENFSAETKNAVQDFGMETKNAVEDFGMETKNAMERFSAETKNTMENFGAETKNAMESFGAETKNVIENFSVDAKHIIEDYGSDTKNTIEDMHKCIISAEETSSQKQEQLEEEIREICREQAEAAEASRKLLTETFEDMKRFVQEESRLLLAEFGEENKLQLEQFSEECDCYIERLQKECLAALEQCSGLMGDFLPQQEALVKELRAMCQEQSENSNASRSLIEEMESFVREQTCEIRRENQSNIDAFAQRCGEYTQALQEECRDSLEKCNNSINEFCKLCVDELANFAENSELLLKDYNDGLERHNDCMTESMNSHKRRVSEKMDEMQSEMDKFMENSEAMCQSMMDKLIDAVKKVNEENAQYIQQIKDYQRELKQLSADDIKIMEEILHGNR